LNGGSRNIPTRNAGTRAGGTAGAARTLVESRHSPRFPAFLMSLRYLPVVLCALAITTLAQAQSAPKPPPPPPPLPADAVLPPPAPPEFATADDPAAEPQVTIIRRGADTHEEVRVNGELRYIRVTPRIGPSYFLVPQGPGQQFLRRDSLDFGLRVPMWQLFSW